MKEEKIKKELKNKLRKELLGYIEHALGCQALSHLKEDDLDKYEKEIKNDVKEIIRNL